MFWRKSCAFTGHRPSKFPWKYNEEDPRCIALKATLDKVIRRLEEDGVKDFYSGMAEGTDTWAALSVLAHRQKNPSLRLHCILPFPGQADRWSPSSQELYKSILEQADSVKYVSKYYYKDCFLDRNHRLVNASDIVLAVYGSGWHSGTEVTLRYAQIMRKRIITIHPLTLEIDEIARIKGKFPCLIP